jgi:Tol biopolymer transport system component
MSDEILQQAIGLIKAGKSDEARGLLYHLVKTDPNNEMAWLWLSETMNDNQKRKTIEQGLKFNPGSQKLQHALSRLPAQPSPPKEEPRPAPSIPTTPVDRSAIQTARLTFIEDEPPDAYPSQSAPVAKSDPSATQPLDRTLIKTAPLPPAPPDKIDRSLIHTARLEMPPDELNPDNLPPDMQLPEKPPAASAPKPADRSTVQTARLDYAPEGSESKPAPAVKAAAATTMVSAAAPKPVPPPAQTPAPPDKIDRSLLRAARIEQASEPPHQTGPLPVPPAMAPQPPPKPKAEPQSTGEPVTALRQEMDTLLTEPHPSPDPVKGGAKPASPPPAPPFPPVKEETFEPPRKRRRRFSGLEIALIIIAVLLLIGVGGYFVWELFFMPPPVPTPAVVVPPITQPTATILPATSTPQELPTPIPPPTLRPTFTPMITPTATLNPDSPSVLFFDPQDCAVEQVSASGGAALQLTENSTGNCLGPELALDGTKFAYRFQNAETKAIDSLSVANVDGSLQTALIEKNASPIWEVDWAPDNTWLSYTAVVGTNNANPPVGIYLIRADGSGQAQVTNDLIPSIVPDSGNAVAWAPDGQWLAFYADNRPYIIKPDGTGAKQLSKDAGLSAIAWSPDSRQIAFYSSSVDNPGIVVVGVDGKQTFVGNKTLKVPVSGDALLWTPDGKQFVAYDIGQKALVLVSRDGTQIKPLASVSGVPTRLAWSPDGTQLAYIELPQQDSPTGVLKVVNIDGKGLITLATSVANSPLRWKVPVNFAGTLTPVPVINIPTATSTPSPVALTPSPTP